MQPGSRTQDTIAGRLCCWRFYKSLCSAAKLAMFLSCHQAGKSHAASWQEPYIDLKKIPSVVIIAAVVSATTAQEKAQGTGVGGEYVAD